MSFSSDTKDELCKIQNKRDCCKTAEGYGLLLFSRCFSLLDRKAKIENGNVARLIAQYAASCAGVIATVSVRMHARSKEAYQLSIEGEDQREQLLAIFGHGDDVNLSINREFIENPCCPSAFLRGVFISCGAISDPNKDYHLEFVVPHKVLAEDLIALINELELDFQPSIAERSGNYIVYIKDSTKIEDFLTYIGAVNASMELMQIKMYKDAMNNINRKSNFETANMDKTYSASAKQTLAIAIIMDTIGMSSLSDDLRHVAELRLENPEMTLKQMSEVLHISRSGVNHRIQRLIAIAEDASGGKKIDELIARQN